jgi:hypothetical protein
MVVKYVARGIHHSRHLAPRFRMSRAIPLLPSFAAVVCLTLSSFLSEENRCFCKAVSTQIRRLISPQYEVKKCGYIFPVFHMPSRRLLEHKNLHSSSGVERLRKCMNRQNKILPSQFLTLYIVYVLTLKVSRHKRDVLSCRHISVNFCFTDYLVHIS